VPETFYEPDGAGFVATELTRVLGAGVPRPTGQLGRGEAVPVRLVEGLRHVRILSGPEAWTGCVSWM